jgi:hypothetical protein
LNGEKTPNKTETEINFINQRIIAKMQRIIAKEQQITAKEQQISAKEQQIVEALRGKNLLRAAG